MGNQLLRKFLITTAMVAAAAFAPVVHAAEAARVVFVAGNVQSAGTAVKLGHAVQEGDEIATGADGYVYLKTVDNGFLILRPSSKARIAAYHIDKVDPAGTRIKLELLSGVARHISGDAVKVAKQNFRFNTPVAAIGVRGTDFTVFTDQDVSRVVVLSGGVVVSGFSGACGPEGFGPCEGKSSLELFAKQVGDLMQISRGQPVPQILRSSGDTPDVVAPPRMDEPGVKTSVAPTAPAGGNVASVNPVAGSAPPLSNERVLEPQKSADINKLVVQVTPPVTVPVVKPVPEVVTPVPVAPPPAPPLVIVPTPVVVPTPAPTPIETPVVVVPPAPVIPGPPQIVWGRWQSVAALTPNIDLAEAQAKGNQLIATNSYFILLRPKGSEWMVPERGNIGFSLKQSEAYIKDQSNGQVVSAALENGKLVVDFGTAKFATSFDLVSLAERFKFLSQGDVSKDGLLFGESQFNRPTNMSVNGVLSQEGGGTAAYLFQGRIDDQRLATGTTYWAK